MAPRSPPYCFATKYWHQVVEMREVLRYILTSYYTYCYSLRCKTVLRIALSILYYSDCMDGIIYRDIE